MPTSFSLQDLRQARLNGKNNGTSATNGPSLYSATFYGEFVEEEEVEEIEVKFLPNLIDDPAGLDIESEQIIVDSSPVTDHQDQQDESHAQEIEVGNEVVILQPELSGNDLLHPVNVDNSRQMLDHNCLEFNSDFPLFENSKMTVQQFSTEFLAIARRHRLRPKAKAILLDLFHRIMPGETLCPPSVKDLRKLLANDGQIHWFGASQGKLLPSHSKTFVRDSEFCLPNQGPILATLQSSLSKDVIDLPRQFNSHEMLTSSSSDPLFLLKHYYYEGETKEGCSDDHFIDVDSLSQIDGLNESNCRALLPQMLETIDRLSKEVVFLRSLIRKQQQENQQNSHGNYGTTRKAKRRTNFTDGRLGIHIFDEHECKTLLSQLTQEEVQGTVEVSRNDDTRLIYVGNDITEMVLEKIDLTTFIYNPSLCGRMVADVLFSPEYLADKHILGEGQSTSRARLETLPPEMTQLFYDSLRKLGASRISEEDQEHWLYLARDGVNQRARDLKANRKRKFYIDEQPLFTKDKT